jgi:catechol 2,3-dioxygenase-like lactoylglutathione lyase family enzyme
MNLNQVTISSLDVTASTEFYTVLGLNIIVNALPNYVRFECPNGGATFSIHSIDALPDGNKITLYFEVDSLFKTISELKQKGITFNTEILEQPWLWSEAHLNDPDGHHIIISHAGENRKNPSWRVNN